MAAAPRRARNGWEARSCRGALSAPRARRLDLVWLPAWAACGDDDGAATTAGAAARDGAAGGSGGSGAPDGRTPDAGTPATPRSTQVPSSLPTRLRRPAAAGDTCEPLLTPVPVFSSPAAAKARSPAGRSRPRGGRLPAGDRREVGTALSLSWPSSPRPHRPDAQDHAVRVGQRGTGIYRGVTVRTLLEQAGIDRDAAVRVPLPTARTLRQHLRIETCSLRARPRSRACRRWSR